MPWTYAKRFQFRSLLGRGGMGAVFDAIDTHASPPAQVAVKVIAVERHGTVIQDLFDREQSFAQALVTAEPDEHAHHFFVRILASDRSATTPYLVMEHLGPPRWNTLAALLGRAPEGRLPIDEVVALGIQFSRALARLAGKRIVHRDLKPENVFVSDQARIKISDLGGGINCGSDVTSAAAPPVQLLTRGYASPDHFEPATITPAADMFSVGCILWRCATGELPYQAAALGMPIIEEPESGKDLPIELRRLLLSMLDEKPQHRPPPRTLRDHLEQRRAAWLLGSVRDLGDRVTHEGTQLSAVAQATPADPGLIARASEIGLAMSFVDRHLGELRSDAARLGAIIRGDAVELPLAPPPPTPIPQPAVDVSERRRRVAPMLGVATLALALGFVAGVVPSRVGSGKVATPDPVPGPATVLDVSQVVPACSVDPLRCTFDRACQAGDISTCVVAGRLSQLRHRVDDRAAALRYFQMACDGNNADGCQELTRITYSTYVPSEKRRATDAMRTMCERGHAASCVDLAHAELNNDDPAAWSGALGRLLEPCLEEGNLRACRSIGRFKVFSPVPNFDDPKAGVGFLVKACDGGFHEACADLAIARAIGVHGTSGDASELIRGAAPSCDAGNGRACFALALAEREDDIMEGKRLAQSCTLGFPDACAGYAVWLDQHDEYVKASRDRASDRRKLVRTLVAACDDGEIWACLFEARLDGRRAGMILPKTCGPRVPQGCGDLAAYLVSRNQLREANELVGRRCRDGEGDFEACYVLATSKQLDASPARRAQALRRACSFLPADDRHPACETAPR